MCKLTGTGNAPSAEMETECSTQGWWGAGLQDGTHVCPGTAVVSHPSRGEDHLQPSVLPGPLGWPAVCTCPSMAGPLSLFIFLNFSLAEVCAAACAILQCSEISHTCRQSAALLLLGGCSEGGFHYCLTPVGREVEQFSCLAKNRRRDFPFSLWPVQ